MVAEIKTVLDFKDAIGTETTGLVIVDFFAVWCGPCKRIFPKYEELSQKYDIISTSKLFIFYTRLILLLYILLMLSIDKKQITQMLLFCGFACVYIQMLS